MTKENLKPISDNIKIIKNDSVSESENYEDNFFDIVYIDASNDYQSVILDIKSWLPKVKFGGYICGDDYVETWPEVQKAVKDFFGDGVS